MDLFPSPLEIAAGLLEMLSIPERQEQRNRPRMDTLSYNSTVDGSVKVSQPITASELQALNPTNLTPVFLGIASQPNISLTFVFLRYKKTRNTLLLF